jgi:hypothetical protein
MRPIILYAHIFNIVCIGMCGAYAGIFIGTSIFGPVQIEQVHVHEFEITFKERKPKGTEI